MPIVGGAPGRTWPGRDGRMRRPAGREDVTVDGRCGSCAHWAEPNTWMRVGDFRACTLLPGSEDLLWEDSDADAMDQAFPGIQAYTADASSYASSLMCSPEFGCVHWEVNDG